MLRYFKVFQNVISEAEAALLVDHINVLTRRRKYEGNHWDSVIAQYKELELSPRNADDKILREILLPVQQLVQWETRTDGCEYLPPHVIDLSSSGFIAPHVDSVKASGGVVAGLSLLSTRVLQLSLPEPGDSPRSMSSSNNFPEQLIDSIDSVNATSYGCRDDQSPSTVLRPVYEFLLHPRSVYVLQGPARFQYAHAVLGRDCARRLMPAGAQADRRLSIMFRDALPTARNPTSQTSN